MENSAKHLLEVKDLRTSFFTSGGEVKAVNGVSYYIDRGEVIAIVGESGCGKSVTQLSVVQLVQSPPGRIMGGQVILDGEDLMKLAPNSKRMRAIRGEQISMIFQEPMTSLNPIITVGNQLSEVIRTHKHCGRREAARQAADALKAVGIPDAAARLKSYPFEMSGGMRQRVMIATAVACGAKLIVADEPTTALDVTTQAQVMELLMDIVEKMGTSLLIITHNLGLVNRYARRIYVMYAGKIVESGTTEELLTRPKHPYTVGLLESVPRLDGDADSCLVPIQGAPPDLARTENDCAFRPRCKFACEACKELPAPELRRVSGEEHYVACHVNIDEVRR